ncbi:hypothetical protein TorRG33x02_216910, partial [Trema orientale]
TTTGPNPDPGDGAFARLGSKIFDCGRTCPAASPSCSDRFSTSGQKISTLVENIRLGLKPPVKIFDWRSTVVEKFRPQLNIAGRLPDAAFVTFDFFGLVKNFRLGSSQG